MTNRVTGTVTGNTPATTPSWRRPPTVGAGMRIGLLGGSFNPPHGGHREISLGALQQLALDRVWWLVTPGNPLKSHDELAALGKRIEASEAVADHPRIDVTGFEADLGSAYTAATLEHIATRFPTGRFVWLMGADNLADFHRWRDWRGIAATFPFAVADRPGWRYRALASRAATALARYRIPVEQARELALLTPPAWTMLGAPLNPQSSSKLREAAASANVDPFSLRED